ncbi:leucine-rich repeat-containing protein 31 [Hyla sarda]|uniref:leucine-rich repeat-containing protein 31 n=1 Tax=Hyla sarda TaxID=327740 RepID=UPI0024C3C049|nr:leucine-rich repeat-containing protein 31 [Hyla sarda]XP_056421099.1 leucine-rich repeat-containing protein 31 [Hyla sarda]
MEMKGSEKIEEQVQKRSPFDMLFGSIQRKKSDKEKTDIFQVKRFFKAFDKEATKTTNEKNEEVSDIKPGPGDYGDYSKTNEETSPTKEEDPLDLDLGWWKVKQFMEKYDKKAEIQFINLNNCGLTATGIKELGSLMPYLPDVEEMNLSWNESVGGSMVLMTPHLCHVTRLRILSLSNCGLTADDAGSLGEALQHIPNLQVLDLSWNSDFRGALSRLTQHFSSNCELKSLSLTECSLKAEDGDSLAHALRKMPKIEFLELSANKELGSAIKNITEELKNCSSLCVLKLRSTGLRQDSISYLSSAFQYWPYLRKLDLSCNKATGGFCAAAARLTAFKRLELLDIHQCSLSKDDVTALTQVIPLLSNLQFLDLSSNKSIGFSSEHLFSRLRFLPKLKSVNISNCTLQKDSFAGLAEASHYLLDLEMLDLSWNKCVGGNLKLLFETLKSAIGLQSLLLSSCNLVTQDLAVIASVAQNGNLERLEQLDIAYNDTIPDEGWSLFFESVSALKNIVELDISLRPSTSHECGPWFIHLLSNLVKLPKLKELGMQRWALSAAERQQLSRIQMENNINIHYD